jgi:hypothetical protein
VLRIEPEIEAIKVVVSTATSLVLTVMCVPAPTSTVLAADPLYADEATKPLPIVKSSKLFLMPCY